jgi:hypothetical protein
MSKITRHRFVKGAAIAPLAVKHLAMQQAPALPTASTSHLRQLTKIDHGEFPSSHRWAVLQFVAPALAHGSSDMPVWGNLFGSLDPRIRMIR